MIVVFDSNVWLAEASLRSTRGAVARYFLKRHSARVAIPEVVRLEVERHLKNDLNQYITDLRDNHRRLLTIFGEMRELTIPSKDDVDARVAALSRISAST